MECHIYSDVKIIGTNNTKIGEINIYININKILTNKIEQTENKIKSQFQIIMI